MDERSAAPSLAGIFGRFLRFGFLAWGGPVAQIAMIKRELVDEERWLTVDKFNRLLAVYQVLPGPEAHELCVHLGMLKGGRLGGLLAGLGFMLPGLVLVLGLAWAYQSLQLKSGPWPALLLGIQIAVIALIVRAVHRIGEHVLSGPWLWGVAIALAAATLLGSPFWILLPAAGATCALARKSRPGWAGAVLLAGLVLAFGWTFSAGIMPAASPVEPGAREAPTTSGLLLSGLKAGLLTFGGAYTAIPFVRGDAVGRQWITDGQFLDGLALSSIIPAPLIIFATFTGYQAGGFAGAMAMTLGIFLPAFAFGLLFYDRLERVIENERLHDVLAGVAAGVVGIVAAALVELSASVASSVPSITEALLILAASLALLYGWRSRLNVLLLMPSAALAGWLIFGDF